MENKTQNSDEVGNLHKPLVSRSPISSIFIGIHKENKRKVFTNFSWGRNGMPGGGWVNVVEDEKEAKKPRIKIERIQFDVDPYDYDWFVKTFDGEICPIINVNWI